MTRRPQKLDELENITFEMDQRYTGELSEPYSDDDDGDTITVQLSSQSVDFIYEIANKTNVPFDMALDNFIQASPEFARYT